MVSIKSICHQLREGSVKPAFVNIIETKGQEDLDVPLKTERLKQWCKDINYVQKEVKYDFVSFVFG